MFTFVSITYNHEKFIIEHLESIKFQIEHFGSTKEHNLIVSDDSSTDSTLILIEKWLDKNENLFKKVDILRSTANQGIVKNFLRAINSIEGPMFKILAGDDLYYKNDISGVINKDDIIFTPSIGFNHQGVYKDNGMFFLINHRKIHQIKKWLKVGNMFSAPGVFFKLDVLQDTGLAKSLIRFKWVEDLPLWHYIFFEKKKIHYSINYKPYILYRRGSGISNDYTKNKNSEFYNEVDYMRKVLGMKFNWMPINKNPYKLLKKVISMKNTYVDSKIDNELMQYNRIIEQAIKEVPLHVEYIKSEANIFLNELEGEKYNDTKF